MICKIKDLDLFYEDIGTGIPMIIIHGSTLDHRSMKACMEPIFENELGWRRIYIDLPGHGMTKGADWIKNSDDMLQVVIDFIEQIIPNERFLVTGLSYGGYIARGLVFQKMSMIDGLLLIVPRIISNPTERILPPRTIFDRDEAFLDSLPQQARPIFEEVSVLLTKEMYNRYSEEITNAVQIADHSFLERLDNSVDKFSFDVDNLPEEFDKPSLFLLGRQDHIVGFEDALNLIDQYPRASIAILDKAGHGLQMEQVEPFEALVKNWLNRIRQEQ